MFMISIMFMIGCVVGFVRTGDVDFILAASVFALSTSVSFNHYDNKQMIAKTLEVVAEELKN